MNKEKLIKVTRSFRFLLNAGNYENREFYCEQSKECLESEAVEVSKALYDFCKSEVIKSVNEFRIGTSKAERKDKAGFEARDEMEIIQEA